MSSAFLKKSLELVDSGFVQRYKVLDKDGKTEVYSELKILNKVKKHKDLRSAADVKKKNLESIDKVKRELRKRNNRSTNKKKFDLLHKPVNEKLSKKILEQLGKALPSEPPKKEETVFTEEDFLNFEKDYIAV